MMTSEWKGCIRVQGRLLPLKDVAVLGDRDEDVEPSDSSDPEFLDIEEIEGGAVQIPSSSLENTTVKILAEDAKEYKVTGGFVLIDPWWSVTVYVTRDRYSVKGFPSYKLEDDALENESILSLFLNACNVHEDFISCFITWVKNYPPVTFSRLENLAEKFKKKEDIDIVPNLRNSEHGSFVLKALRTPLVLSCLPKLLPHKMKGLIKLCAKDRSSVINTPPDILFKLENVLETNPWKLGFRSVLYDELKLSGCEATLENLLKCDDFPEKIPNLQLDALYIYDDLKKICMNLGDTYVKKTDLLKSFCKNRPAGNASDAIDFLKEQKIVVIEGEWVFLHNYFFYEVDTAKYISTLVMKRSQNAKVKGHDVLVGDHTPQKDENVVSQALVDEFSDEQIKKLQINNCLTEDNLPTELDAEQQRAARMIKANPVTIISGKGGCGKTTVVSIVFKTFMQQEKDEVESACKAIEDDMDTSQQWALNPVTSTSGYSDSIRFLLTAPTGKASSLLRKKTGLPSATLHQITCSYWAWRNRQRKKEESSKEHIYPWKFCNVEALVVDEGSLVSVRIFSSVLKLLYTHAKLAKLVILGDIQQLPSIEPGNLLADMFAIFKIMNWSIELKTNHRAESQLIVDNATRISNQKNIQFDHVLHFNGKKTCEMPSEEKKCILVSLDHESYLSLAIEELIKHGPGLNDDKHSQFIAFRRKDCLLINEVCCKKYSNHTTKDLKNVYNFQCNDKVCCTKNAYVKDLQTPSRFHHADQNTDHSTQGQGKSADDERLCNGEIFYIIDDKESDKIRELTLTDEEERTYTLNYKALRSQSGLSHAWARTIHTFQGSEEDTVVYVVGAAGRQTWKHVYTAVTRGRKRIYIIAMSGQLDQAIRNRSRKRQTTLQQRLMEGLSKSGSWPEPGTQYPGQDPFTNSCSPQMTQDEPAQALHNHLRDPTLPTAADVAFSRKDLEHGDCSAGLTMLSPLDRSMDPKSQVFQMSPSQKRAGVPDDGMESPLKLCRFDMNLPESPSSAIKKLSIHGSCKRKL